MVDWIGKKGERHVRTEKRGLGSGLVECLKW
jgi:hypothetical protein